MDVCYYIAKNAPTKTANCVPALSSSSFLRQPFTSDLHHSDWLSDEKELWQQTTCLENKEVIDNLTGAAGMVRFDIYNFKANNE